MQSLSLVVGVRESLAPTLFQFPNIEIGKIRFVQSEIVKEMIFSYQQRQ